MSMTFGATVSQPIYLASQALDIEREFFDYHQSAIREAALAGEAWLKQNFGTPGHTPYASGLLLASVQTPIQNQYSVTFRIGGSLIDNTGRLRPYGFAQEEGWHQRLADGTVAFHEGQHMVQHAAEAGAQAYLAILEGWGSATAMVGLQKQLIGSGVNPGFRL